MSEETKITHESLDNLNEAIKSNIGNDNKPTKYLNVSGVYKYNNVNYTRPLRTDKFGNLKIANDSTEAQEVTNPTLTNLNNTIKNNSVSVNVNNLDSLSITDEFLEKQNLSAFQDVSKEAQKLRNDASTFPKLLVHNVRPETTPVVNQTDINNDIIPLQCNVDNTIESGQVIKPLQSTIRALPGSAAEDSDVKVNPKNVSRNEIMADSTSDGADGLKYPNALQTVDQNLKNVFGTDSLITTEQNLKTEDQNLKTVFGTGNYRLDVDGLSAESLEAKIGQQILYIHPTYYSTWHWKSNHYLISTDHINGFSEPQYIVLGTGANQINQLRLYTWWIEMAKSDNIQTPTHPFATIVVDGISIPKLRDVREHHYIIDNTNHKDVRIFGSIVWSTAADEEDNDPQFFIIGSNNNIIYYKIYIIEKSQTIPRTDGYDGINSDITQNDFDILIRNAPKYLKFKNSENGRTINSARIYYSQYT